MELLKTKRERSRKIKKIIRECFKSIDDLEDDNFNVITNYLYYLSIENKKRYNILRLRFVENYTVIDIAYELSTSEDSVWFHLSKSLSKIKEMLIKKGVDL